MACGKCGSTSCGPIIVRPDIAVQTLDQEFKILCDDNGQFLRRYTTDDSGNVSVVDTELDGVSPYSVSGEVGVCEPEQIPESPGEFSPGEVCGSTELVQLCDLVETSPSESPGESDQERIPFLRRFTFDCEGVVLSTDDLDLDGLPYSVQGDVVLCSDEGSSDTCGLSPDDVISGESNSGQSGELQVTDNTGAVNRNCAHVPSLDDNQDIWDGNSITTTPDLISASNCENPRWTYRETSAILQAERPNCDNGTARISASVHVELLPPNPGAYRYLGGLRFYNARTNEWFEYDTIGNPDDFHEAPGYQKTLAIQADIPAIDLAQGNVYVWLAWESWEDIPGGSGQQGPKSWQISNFQASYEYNVEGCIEETESLAVKFCSPVEVKYTPPPQTGPTDVIPAGEIIKICRCDDADLDGLPDTAYTELWKVSENNEPVLIYTYAGDNINDPYDPTNPVPCDADGDQITSVQAHRVRLATSEFWDADNHPLLQSVTFINVGTANSVINTIDGPSFLYPGESVSWSVTKDYDTVLRGPLRLTSVGTVVVSWTEGVTT